jgi:hypothetical protein
MQAKKHSYNHLETDAEVHVRIPSSFGRVGEELDKWLENNKQVRKMVYTP